MKLKVVLEPSEEGGFIVYVPSLPGCVSEGETEQEALQNIREAVALYFEPVDDDLAGIGKHVRIPLQIGHHSALKPATHSGVNRPPFRSKSATPCHRGESGLLSDAG